MKTSFLEVAGAVKDERDYQDYRWPGHKHSYAEFLVYIKHYVDEGMKAETLVDTPDGAAIALRKIAALAFAAQEENGVVRREGW